MAVVWTAAAEYNITLTNEYNFIHKSVGKRSYARNATMLEEVVTVSRSQRVGGMAVGEEGAVAFVHISPMCVIFRRQERGREGVSWCRRKTSL